MIYQFQEVKYRICMEPTREAGGKPPNSSSQSRLPIQSLPRKYTFHIHSQDLSTPTARTNTDATGDSPLTTVMGHPECDVDAPTKPVSEHRSDYDHRQGGSLGPPETKIVEQSMFGRVREFQAGRDCSSRSFPGRGTFQPVLVMR